uniref:Uncharacterized protein n=1 Tax=Oryza brachyantha TaxID=4533 RepID=J3KUR0_ORYBR
MQNFKLLKLTNYKRKCTIQYDHHIIDIGFHITPDLRMKTSLNSVLITFPLLFSPNNILMYQ